MEKVVVQASIITDQLAYMRAYASRFPEEDGTSTENEFERLMAMIRVFEGTFSGDRQWLTLAISEIEQARVAYGEGNESGGEKLLTAAVEHFKMGTTGKRPRTAYIVTPEGNIGEE